VGPDSSRRPARWNREARAWRLSIRERLAALESYSQRSGYAAIQGIRPQTLAYALNDSPAGVLAWNTEWFEACGQRVGVFDRDAILTNVMLYWLTGTSGSSARLYLEGGSEWGIPEPIQVPTGVAVLPHDSRPVRRLAERTENIVHWTEFACCATGPLVACGSAVIALAVSGQLPHRRSS